jgi:hypothetical protein
MEGTCCLGLFTLKIGPNDYVWCTLIVLFYQLYTQQAQ